MDQERIAYTRVASDGIRAMLQLEEYVKQSGLEPGLLDLVRTRVSEINRCAYCIDMHTKDARARGETEQRLYELPAWRETPFYSDRERAALAWAEAVTVLSQNSIPNELFQQARGQFSEKELVDLTLAIIAINSWNRLAVPFRTVPGTYNPARHHGQQPVHL
ncbi:MAG TPA: carboxymuconolactone decarboxylase family protein [Gemmatimonadales bacterium]|nr:carboxymuconolactone decarboxylase family protein [Gemmatimonadales bacterium]